MSQCQLVLVMASAQRPWLASVQPLQRHIALTRTSPPPLCPLCCPPRSGHQRMHQLSRHTPHLDLHQLVASAPVPVRLKVAACAQRQQVHKLAGPVSAQPTARRRSPCISDMSCTGARAKGRRTRGGRRTKGNRAAPCASHSCAETHMPRNDCATDSSGSGSVGCAAKCSGAGAASSSLPCCCLGLSTPLLARLIFCDVCTNVCQCEGIGKFKRAVLAAVADGCGAKTKKKYFGP